MKKLLKILFVVLVISLLTRCHPTRYIRTILHDDITRSQMYHEILKNNTYRSQLLDSLRSNKSTRSLLIALPDENRNEGRNSIKPSNGSNKD